MNKENAITLIALIITIIIMLILAGVVINLTIGENGIITKSQNAGSIYEEAEAREKLELVLLDLQSDKLTNISYNENEYIDNRIIKQQMTITEDIVNVNGWEFQIDRSVPKIIANLGKNSSINDGKLKNVHYLYYKGDEYIEEGGEWINNPISNGSNLGNLVKETDNMIFEGGTVTTTNNPICTKENTMDISQYDEIKMEIEMMEEDITSTYRNVSIFILDKDGNSIAWNPAWQPALSSNRVPDVGEKVTISMDLNDIIDLEEVYFGLSLNGYKVKVHSIYLEKYKHNILNLYNAGNEYLENGGEWINNPLCPESTAAELSKEDDNMVFTCGYVGASNPGCTKKETMDISSYDKIRIEMEIIEEYSSTYWRNVTVGVLDKDWQALKFDTKYQPSGNKPNVIGKVRLSTDLTDIENDKLKEVYFGLCNNSYKVRIYRIWLDKIIK